MQDWCPGRKLGRIKKGEALTQTQLLEDRVAALEGVLEEVLMLFEFAPDGESIIVAEDPDEVQQLITQAHDLLYRDDITELEGFDA